MRPSEALPPAPVRRTRRERLLELLSDGHVHGQDQMEQAGGRRYGARLLELRREGYSVIVQAGLEPGSYFYRLAGWSARSADVRAFIEKAPRAGWDWRVELGGAGYASGLADALASALEAAAGILADLDDGGRR